MKKIPIKGAIVSNNQRWVYEWLDMDATSPRDVSQALDNANGEDIELEINSGGGSVVAGSEIWTALKEYKGKVTSKIVGIAGSAASFIAIAADNVMISPTALIMIHNASNIVAGDKRDMQHMANTLASVDEAISNAYRMKTGKDKDELLALMADETYMNAQLAKELGFADEIMFEEGDQLVASFNQSSILKIRTLLPSGKMSNTRTKGIYTCRDMFPCRLYGIGSTRAGKTGTATISERGNSRCPLY